MHKVAPKARWSKTNKQIEEQATNKQIEKENKNKNKNKQ